MVIIKKTLEKIETEIETLQNQLSEGSSSIDQENFKKEIEKQFVWEVWEREIQELKTKKFSRDLNDFQQKQVYKWRQRHQPRKMSRSSSFSSVSSQGDRNRPKDQSMTTRSSAKKKETYYQPT